jgi:transposase
LAVDTDRSRRRAVVERCRTRLTQWRGRATRFEQRAVNDRAMVVIAAILRSLPP